MDYSFLLMYIKAMTFLVCILEADNALSCFIGASWIQREITPVVVWSKTTLDDVVLQGKSMYLALNNGLIVPDQG